jgi:uncharacterized repeat protein (TIGR01451 family)
MKHARTLFVAGPALVAMGLFATPALAAGVEAGTLIANTASATYNSGASSGSVQSNTVTVRVDELLDVVVSGTATSPVLVGSGTAILPFTVTNTGNGPEAFNLTVAAAVSGNQFDVTVQSIVIDSNNNGTYEPGVDTVLASGAPTPLIGSDDTLNVFVLVTLPAGATDGQTSQLRLTAAAVTGTGAPGTTFAGQGEGGGDAVVGNSGADDDGLDPMIASAASVTLTKSATILDPFGGSRPVPGAVVTYTIVAAVSGSGTADNLLVTDNYPAGTAYEPGTLRLDAATLTDAADADAGQASATGIQVNLGNVPGGSSKTVTFDVKIN